MKFDLKSPPNGTVRDWLNYRGKQHGNKIAFTFLDGSSPISWTELEAKSRKLANQLTYNNIQKGESVAIMHENGRNAIEALFGVLYGGFRATLINLLAGDTAMNYALEHCDARVALVGDEQKAQFKRVRPKSINMFSQINTQVVVNLHHLGAEDEALLMYTSGTTGKPKGVIHTHASLLAGGWTPTIAHKLTNNDCGLCVLPIYHINGLCVTVMGTLISGGSLAVAKRFSASNFWKQCEISEITWFSVVPTIISHLLNSQFEPSKSTIARLRFGRSASSALAPDVQKTFENRFGTQIVETMGLTETAAQILSNPLFPALRKVGSSGIPFGNKACILSPGMRKLPANRQGEIAVRGANIMRGYFKNQEATEDAFTPEGWLRTGDLGYFDDDGYYFISGRLKELIIKGGENISPREIDDVLYSHPDIVEAAAFSCPCTTYGERVEAAVKLRDDTKLTQENIIEICHKKLGKFKSPDKVYILKKLPKGPSGKIQRIKLLELTRETKTKTNQE